MRKCDPLWHRIALNGSSSFLLTFRQIERHAGVPMDHSFPKYKQELTAYCFRMTNISMKEQTIHFDRLEGYEIP